MALNPSDETTDKTAATRDMAAVTEPSAAPTLFPGGAAPGRGGFHPDAALSPDAWRTVLCRHAVIPYTKQGGTLVLAAGTYADALRTTRDLGLDGSPVKVRLVARSKIVAALVARYADALTHRATDGLRRSAPVLSAATRFPRWMQAIAASALLALVAALLFMPMGTILNLWIVFLPYFVATMLLRVILIAGSLGIESRPPPPRRRTPVVSILVPVYDEAQSMPALVAALTALDYPTRALDIKILLEADDAGTVAEARWLTAGTHIDCLVVPPSTLRTKPKIMNFALPFARGEIVGIFDAEDAPEPDQISKAVATLEAADEDVVCAQARLSYYNAHDNLLTRCVAMEYALWFDMLLTGMTRLRLPIPLGGTSLYFRGIA